jgi:hypothetical protein
LPDIENLFFSILSGEVEDAEEGRRQRSGGVGRHVEAGVDDHGEATIEGSDSGVADDGLGLVIFRFLSQTSADDGLGLVIFRFFSETSADDGRGLFISRFFSETTADDSLRMIICGNVCGFIFED